MKKTFIIVASAVLVLSMSILATAVVRTAMQPKTTSISEERYKSSFMSGCTGEDGTSEKMRQYCDCSYGQARNAVGGDYVRISPYVLGLSEEELSALAEPCFKLLY